MSDFLKSIEDQQENMENLVQDWANINSHSYNIEGLDKFRAAVKTKFEAAFSNIDIEEMVIDDQEIVNDKAELVKIPLAKVLRITKNNAKADAKKVLLMGHLDTVFPVNSHFQTCRELPGNKINGPGVSDLKGGIVVMLEALKAFETLETSDNIAWQVFLNSEEEIGSPGSQKLFSEICERNDIGLIYEPSLEDGSIAFKRKGAGNFTLVFKGRAAHVGREFAQGRSAIFAAARFMQEFNTLASEDIIVNFGKIQGGGPLNVVPDLCTLGINIRIESQENIAVIEKHFEAVIDKVSKELDLEISLHGKFNRKPKIPNEKLEKLYDALSSCASELSLDFAKRNTGGCCDGNNLYEFGLVNIDTLGVRGAKIHSDEEFICLESLGERAKLTALFLEKLSADKISI